MTEEYTIRIGHKTDMPQIIALCKAHAAFEEAEYDSEDKSELLVQHLFGDSPALKCFVVESKEQLVGYATFMKQFSTWDACFYVYLDCLFLNEDTRSMGIGHQLMKEIGEYAQTEGCDQIQWQTPDFNLDAIKFYKKLGAESMAKERFFWNMEKI